MKVLFLAIVFLTIIVLLAIRRPLYQAILGGLLLTIIFYRIPLIEAGGHVVSVITTWSSLSVLVAFYLISFFQRVLDARSQLKLAQEDLNGIFHNRRINTAGSAIFIGLLPAAAAMVLCSQIVKDASDGYLDKKEQAFVTSWVRHIPESILPTYTGVLLMLNISGIETSAYVIGMLIPVVVLMMIGYFACLRKIPKDPGTPESADKKKDVLHLFKHLWSLMLIVLLILVFKMKVVWAVLVVILCCLVVYRIKWSELKPMFVSAFEKKLLLNTFLVLVLKEFIAQTGVLELLPDMMQRLPLPTYLIFALLFFLVTIISGSGGAIAMGAPLAFAAMPVTTPLVVYLMCITHAASQIGPTHTCIMVASEYYGITIGEMIRKTIPYALLFCVLMTVYYNLWVFFF